RGVVGQEDRRLHARQATGPRGGEAMVAAGRGDDAPRQLFFGRREQAVRGAAGLERAGDLEKLQFQHRLDAGRQRRLELVGPDHGCLPDVVCKAFSGGADVIDPDHVKLPEIRVGPAEAAGSGRRFHAPGARMEAGYWLSRRWLSRRAATSASSRAGSMATGTTKHSVATFCPKVERIGTAMHLVKLSRMPDVTQRPWASAALTS